jgi:SAM-dependent methyltransferase
VTAVDGAPTLLAAAAAAYPSWRYLLADVADLPFPDASFDVVVAYNSLMDVHDMPGAMREAARVLRPDAPFVITGRYLDSARFEGPFERNGREMTFRGWSYPLEAYSRALEAASLRHRDAPRAADPGRRGQASPGGPVLSRVPMFLMFRASA